MLNVIGNSRNEFKYVLNEKLDKQVVLLESDINPIDFLQKDIIDNLYHIDI